ncbi:uncharacterized protein LOC117298920 isoform X2 [Asterias rubens]|uniref:uncharacterized protein LOC117298920 isoform X2 n=1 Tax=Asterias rubens TaxID=7604 RepID=UPI001455C9EC|nr:uncharacterized protein LOC117298920 isoform X2 [Asterias rubens]
MEDSEVVAYTEEIQESRLTASSMSSDVVLKPPGNKEIVSLISEKSREGDGMLRVTSDRWDVKGRQGEDLFKVDCSGQYDDPGTKFLWYKPKPTVEEHENCLGAYLNAEDPTKKFPTTGSVEQQYPFRLCCHKMKDGKIHLAAHKAPTGAKDSEGLLYVCKLQERSGIITLQENVSHSDKPLAGSFIGATNTGQVKMFPPSLFEPYTGNPFAYFYLMDLDDEKTESMKRMNGEK